MPENSEILSPNPQPQKESAGNETRILLVDSVGSLAWWGTAKIAFVGGSLGNRGGQNMIEPAAYGAAVSFGPNTGNFRDIVATMLRAEAAVVVHDRVGLSAFIRRCLEEPGYAASLGGRARALVAGQLGATDRTLRLLENLIETQSASSANPSVPISILSAVKKRAVGVPPLEAGRIAHDQPIPRGSSLPCCGVGRRRIHRLTHPTR